MANAICEHECRSALPGVDGVATMNHGRDFRFLTRSDGPTVVDKREPSPVAFSTVIRPHSVRCLSGAAGW
jgi:hypothetical protein